MKIEHTFNFMVITSCMSLLALLNFGTAPNEGKKTDTINVHNVNSVQCDLLLMVNEFIWTLIDIHVQGLISAVVRQCSKLRVHPEPFVHTLTAGCTDVSTCAPGVCTLFVTY